MNELTFKMIEPYINKNEDKNYVIHCNTEEKAEKLFKILNLFDRKDSWYTYREDTCYEIFYFCKKINWNYNNKKYFLKNYSTIIEFDDLFKEKENGMKELTLEIIESYINKCNDNDIIIYCDNRYKINNMFKIFKSNSFMCYQMPSTECLNEQETYFYIRSVNNNIIYEYNNLKCLKEKYNSQIIKYDDLFKEKENKMKIENGYIELNGNRVELTKEQIEKLFGKDNPYEYKEDEIFFYTGSDFEIYPKKSIPNKKNSMNYKNGNYCRDKELKIQDTLHDLLRSKLRQFSMLNGGLDIGWKNEDYKYYIYYYCGKYNIKHSNCIILNDIYFINEETAQRAINEVIIPFEKEHSEFIW